VGPGTTPGAQRGDHLAGDGVGLAFEAIVGRADLQSGLTPGEKCLPVGRLPIGSGTNRGRPVLTDLAAFG
jgi:hypothetical protein